MPTDPNTRFIQELGYHGVMFGASDTAVEDGLDDDVRRYIMDPSAPAQSGIDLHKLNPGLDPHQTALALVAGARHAAAKAREIEVAAARVARLLRPPVTLRALASAAGITERAAATRYRHYSDAYVITSGMQKGGLQPKQIPMASMASMASIVTELAAKATGHLLDEDNDGRGSADQAVLPADGER